MENSRFFRTQSLINYGNPVDLPFVLSFTKKALRFKNTVTHWLELLLLLFFLPYVRQLVLTALARHLIITTSRMRRRLTAVLFTVLSEVFLVFKTLNDFPC